MIIFHFLDIFLDLTLRLDDLGDDDFIDETSVDEFLEKPNKVPLKNKPKKDEFFAEPVGEERGRELFEATTEEYVAHEKVISLLISLLPLFLVSLF